MNIPAVLRIASQPVIRSSAVTQAESGSRGDGTRGRANNSGQTFAVPFANPNLGGDRSGAIVQFGSQARALAQETDEQDTSGSSADVEDSAPLSEPPEFESVQSREDSNSSDNSNESPGSDRNPNSGQGASQGRESDSRELSAEEQQQVQQMRSRDREVRTHEQAHKASGAGHTGSIHLEYEAGPDGRRYAVAGSVSIDTSGVSDDSEATLRKMEVVQRAALAPSNPSSADRQVAAQASRQAQQARAQIAADRYSETQERLETKPSASAKGPTQPTAPSENESPAAAGPLSLVA